jgi:hypothetical protein
MSSFEAIVGLIMGAVSLVVALFVGVRWILATWNRENDGESMGP